MNAGKSLRQVIGEAVRRLRESADKRQDDLSQTARELGLAWPRSKIAALERGDKSISAEELLLLPVLLSWAFGRPVVWAELFEGDDDVDLTDIARVAVRDVPRMFIGGTAGSEVVRLTTQPDRPPSRGPLSLSHVRGRLRDLGLQVDGDKLADVMRVTGETELRAAKRAGEHYMVFSAISVHLWGRSVSAERDARVEAAAEPDAPASTVQARRGRVTRELDDEVRRFIEGAHDGGR